MIDGTSVRHAIEAFESVPFNPLTLFWIVGALLGLPVATLFWLSARADNAAIWNPLAPQTKGTLAKRVIAGGNLRTARIRVRRMSGFLFVGLVAISVSPTPPADDWPSLIRSLIVAGVFLFLEIDDVRLSWAEYLDRRRLLSDDFHDDAPAAEPTAATGTQPIPE